MCRPRCSTNPPKMRRSISAIAKRGSRCARAVPVIGVLPGRGVRVVMLEVRGVQHKLAREGRGAICAASAASASALIGRERLSAARGRRRTARTARPGGRAGGRPTGAPVSASVPSTSIQTASSPWLITVTRSPRRATSTSGGQSRDDGRDTGCRHDGVRRRRRCPRHPASSRRTSPRRAERRSASARGRPAAGPSAKLADDLGRRRPRPPRPRACPSRRRRRRGSPPSRRGAKRRHRSPCAPDAAARRCSPRRAPRSPRAARRAPAPAG